MVPDRGARLNLVPSLGPRARRGLVEHARTQVAPRQEMEQDLGGAACAVPDQGSAAAVPGHRTPAQKVDRARERPGRARAGRQVSRELAGARAHRAETFAEERRRRELLVRGPVAMPDRSIGPKQEDGIVDRVEGDERAHGAAAPCSGSRAKSSPRSCAGADALHSRRTAGIMVSRGLITVPNSKLLEREVDRPWVIDEFSTEGRTSPKRYFCLDAMSNKIEVKTSARRAEDAPISIIFQYSGKLHASQ